MKTVRFHKIGGSEELIFERFLATSPQGWGGIGEIETMSIDVLRY